MFDLPVELQRHCVKYLDVDTVKSLRTVHKGTLSLSTEELFRVVNLFPGNESASKYIKIIENSKLNPLVRKVVFNTSDPDDDDRDGNEEKDIDEEFKNSMRLVGRFENLSEVELKFDDECAAADKNGWDKEVQETVDFRTSMLKKFFKSLNHPTHPATKVDSLTIKHLQDHTVIYDNENFKAVRSRLKKLALFIATEVDDASPENSISMKACHQMFKHDLLDHWLKPLQSQLTHLTIYCDAYWGLWPFCDLQQVHFPHLKSLSLGNFSIAHDWQVDWILSHGSSLEELILDDCPILITLRLESRQCGPNFPELVPTSSDRKPSEYEYVTHVKDVEMRWHEILPRLQKGLSNLKKFAMGHGKWNESLCFEERYEMLPMLLLNRYCIFDCGIGPSHYETYSESWGREEIKFPDCDERDMAALEALVQVVEVRNRM
ncbi:hypothetical protein K505DRAFT_293097 [Melanomma pulvis-pyrius CBS 109.77]|uniref:F-box domain-containing protein n=1 Tax=Melanomma pulvis-pyrius CBS 109.77 TaxID=1314802 RepID=A0A6A6XWQ3_9PLEO|nr:hypothetical protein K505DRAFT_293097 [Melanomma pulvis-pyrius CBS 109.77]